MDGKNRQREEVEPGVPAELDFMIISGGVNIYPREVEDVLTLHPKVTDVAVIGVPDAEMGQRVKAVVQPAPGVVSGPAVASAVRPGQLDLQFAVLLFAGIPAGRKPARAAPSPK